MRYIIVLSMLFLCSNFLLKATEIKYDEVVFENKNGEVFSSNDKGKTWKRLRIQKNPFKEQVFVSEDDKYYSSNTGKDWTVIVNEAENIENNSVKVFPNPVNSKKINLEFDSEIQGICTVKIFNLKGNMIFSDDINNQEKTNSVELNLPDLDNGVYIISFENNGNLKYSKFIVE